MATWADVERIALGLPETEPTTAWGRPAFGVRGAWFVLGGRRRGHADDRQREGRGDRSQDGLHVRR